MKRLFGLIVLTPVFVLAWATSVLADDTFCPPDPGPVTVDNVIVVGEPCTLAGTTVEGDVKVEPGGGLIVTVGTLIFGNVQCDGCNSAAIIGGTIKGDVQIKGATGGTSTSSGHDGFNVPAAIHIFGNVQYEENYADTQLFARGAEIDGDLQIFKNTTTIGVDVEGNTIDGNLQCKENVPAPFALNPNLVDGDKEDQCSGPLF